MTGQVTAAVRRPGRAVTLTVRCRQCAWLAVHTDETVEDATTWLAQLLERHVREQHAGADKETR